MPHKMEIWSLLFRLLGPGNSGNPSNMWWLPWDAAYRNDSHRVGGPRSTQPLRGRTPGFPKVNPRMLPGSPKAK